MTLLDRPAATPQTRLFTNPTDPAYNSDFQTVEFAVNRRFAGRLDGADVVRLHLAGSVPRRRDRHGRDRRSVAPAQGLQLASEPAPLRRRGQGNLDAVELQGHRPLLPARTRSASRRRGSCRAAASGAATTVVTFPGDGAQNVRMEAVDRQSSAERVASSTSAPTSASRSAASVGSPPWWTCSMPPTRARSRCSPRPPGATFKSVIGILDPANRPLRRALRLLSSEPGPQSPGFCGSCGRGTVSVSRPSFCRTSHPLAFPSLWVYHPSHRIPSLLAPSFPPGYSVRWSVSRLR